MRKIIAVLIVAWFISLSYLAEAHPGHQHELLPQEAGVCSVNCQIAAHHRGFFECIWFHLKTNIRSLTPVRELTFALTVQTDLKSTPRLERILNVSASIPVRAPPRT